MRDLTGGRGQVSAPGKTVGRVIDGLDDAYPGVKARLCEGNRINPTITILVDGKVARLGLLETIDEKSEIHFVPAVGGG